MNPTCPHCGKTIAFEPLPIVVRAAEIFDVSAELLSGTSRIRRIAEARFAVAHVLRERGWSLVDIGHALQRDHTTIIHALNQAQDMMARPLFVARIAKLREEQTNA